MTAAFLPGFLLGSSLILAIGAQNAFVLRQGLRRERVLLVCLTCSLSDAVLITLGVTSFGAVAAAVPAVEPILRYGGAAFLVAYALRSLLAAFRKTETLAPAAGVVTSAAATLTVCLALTWLNPHVYLDTVVLLGSVSTQYPGRQAAFAAGAITASFVFFFALGYGARLLRPLFARPLAWRILDLIVAAVMTTIAVGLVVGG